jgi:hypothetical protein
MQFLLSRGKRNTYSGSDRQGQEWQTSGMSGVWYQYVLFPGFLDQGLSVEFALESELFDGATFFFVEIRRWVE